MISRKLRIVLGMFSGFFLILGMMFMYMGLTAPSTLHWFIVTCVFILSLCSLSGSFMLGMAAITGDERFIR